MSDPLGNPTPVDPLYDPLTNQPRGIVPDADDSALEPDALDLDEADEAAEPDIEGKILETPLVAPGTGPLIR